MTTKQELIKWVEENLPDFTCDTEEIKRLFGKLAGPAKKPPGEPINERLGRLRAMVVPKQQTWDLSPNDVEAIAWALEQNRVLRTTRDALVDLCVYWGGAHDIECPEDDTCECSQKPFNDRMQAAIDHANEVLGDQP